MEAIRLDTQLEILLYKCTSLEDFEFIWSTCD